MPSNGITQNGTGDETELSRRGLLRSFAAAGGAGLAAGAGGWSELAAGMPSQAYEADPVALGEDAVELGHRLVDHGSWELTPSAEESRLEEDVALANHFAVYSHRWSHLGLVAMPAIGEDDEPINPLLDRPLAEVVSSDLGASLLHELGFSRYADADWQSGEPIEGDLEFLGSEPETAAFRSGEGAEEQRLLVARTEHEGDVVFGVGAATAPGDPDEEGTSLRVDEDGEVVSGDDWRPDWRGRWLDGIELTEPRIPECFGGGFVHILQPGPRSYASRSGQTIPEQWVELVSLYEPKVTAVAASTGFCVDHLEWSYRLDPWHDDGRCGYSTSWTKVGTGHRQTFQWSICRAGLTYFDIRVQAVDAKGNVLDTDQVSFYYETGR